MKKILLYTFLLFSGKITSQCASPNGQFFNYSGGFPTYASANASGWCVNGLTAGQTYCYTYTYPSTGAVELAMRFTGCASCSNTYLSMTPANGGGCANGSTSCGSLLYNQTCTLIDNNLRVGGTCTVGSQVYTFCFTVPAGCGGMSACPMVKTNAPLPVKWVEVKAESKEEKNIISWTVASELNNDYFEVERSVNGADFETIGKIPGRGNANETKQYVFLDNSFDVTTYYRIKQVDYNGDSEHSKIVSVTPTEKESSTVVNYNMNGQVVTDMSSQGLYLQITIHESGKTTISKIYIH